MQQMFHKSKTFRIFVSEEMLIILKQNKMNNITFSFENETLTMTIDSQFAGTIELGGEEIMYVEIEEEFRGKGLYKMMLTAAFNFAEKIVLYSMNRNEMSNPCYEKWLGKEVLEEDVIVICVDDEELFISKQSDNE